jgi:hypothetical protein
MQPRTGKVNQVVGEAHGEEAEWADVAGEDVGWGAKL